MESCNLISIVFTFIVIIGSTLTANLNPSPTAQSSSEFTASLFNQISEANQKENVVFSPASIEQCIALVYFGAKGQTETEIAQGLHLHTNDKSTVAKRFSDLLKSSSNSSDLLNVVNKIYVSKQYHIKEDFNSIAVESFQSEAEQIDFEKSIEAAQIINHWVETKTNEKIKNLVSSVDSNTAMILVNAIHFKAKWSIVFGKAYPRDFWISTETAVQVPMMYKRTRYLIGDWSDLDAVAVDIPYKDSDFSMVIILPNKRDGLQDLEKKLANVDILNLSNQLESEEIDLFLPKFKIESEFKLNDILQNMGMRSMFTNSADFSDLFEGNAKVKVTEALHKAFIEVNEEGTEASASTYVQKRYLSGDPIEVLVDHPFLFFIKNQHRIYFMGHVTKF